MHDTSNFILPCSSPRYESERKDSNNNNNNNKKSNNLAMEKLKYDLEEEKAQKSFYQAKHKEVSAELQTKTSQLEDCKVGFL